MKPLPHHPIRDLIHSTTQEEIDEFKSRAFIIESNFKPGEIGVGGRSEKVISYMGFERPSELNFYDYKTFPENDISTSFTWDKGSLKFLDTKPDLELIPLGFIFIPSSYGYHGIIKISMQEVVAACKQHPLYSTIRAVEFPISYAMDTKFHWEISRIFTTKDLAPWASDSGYYNHRT